MARKYRYLGRRVYDAKPKGLSSVREVRDITREILRDYRSGRVSRGTALRRLGLLKLAVMRSHRFRGPKREKAIKLIDSKRHKVKKL